MRFMMLMIPKGYESAAPGTMPDPKAVEAMMKYNEALQKAGVLVALDGLHPPSMGARVSFSNRKPTVTDGPFAEAKEVLGGYWMKVFTSGRPLPLVACSASVFAPRVLSCRKKCLCSAASNIFTRPASSFISFFN